jgi:threonine dehydratase
MSDFRTSVTGPRPTTIVRPGRLAATLGCTITVVTETFQHTGSFKFRASWHVASHVAQQRVICASSGNFGQAMAFACQLLGKQCTVVMPATSAQVKIDAVRGYGATADLIDVQEMSREARVEQLSAADPLAYVASAYDDPLVIAGNASLGHEIATLHAGPDGGFDAILVPIGGGGLSSGIITGLRECGVSVPVIAAEPLLGNDFAQSIRAGHRIILPAEALTVADGARTRCVGAHNWAVLQHGVAGVIEVPEDAILAGVRRYFLEANLKVEPTGALSLGAVLTNPDRFAEQHVCVVVSGGNVDPVVYTNALQNLS